MVKIARKQSSKTDFARIYYKTELSFSEILKQKAGNK